MVTAATYRKNPVFRSRKRLDLLLARFQHLVTEHRVVLQAWAISPNHYHFIGVVNDPGGLHAFLQHFHSVTAEEINRLDGTPGRRVWFYPKSYLARLRYVHENPVHHELTRLAANYPWCSAAWFERRATAAFRKTVLHFPCDKLNVLDGFLITTEEIEL